MPYFYIHFLLQRAKVIKIDQDLTKLQSNTDYCFSTTYSVQLESFVDCCSRLDSLSDMQPTISNHWKQLLSTIS